MGLKREEVFISTKLWPSEYENENAVDETLERLGVGYVDLLYIHQPAGNWLAGYRQLEKAYRVLDSGACICGAWKKYGKTAAQAILLWHAQMGFYRDQ